MSRSGYDDCGDYSNWEIIQFRGAVASAIRGKRGQAFLKNMLVALDELPQKRLIHAELKLDNEVCALGAVGIKLGINMDDIDPEDRETVAKTFNIPLSLASEIMFENDEAIAYWQNETPEQRWDRMHVWVKSHIKDLPNG